MTMKTVKFLMPYTVGALYNEGEVAGFDEAIAKDLIDREIAEPFKAAKSGAKSDGDDAAAKKAAEEAAKAASGGGAS